MSETTVKLPLAYLLEATNTQPIVGVLNRTDTSTSNYFLAMKDSVHNYAVFGFDPTSIPEDVTITGVEFRARVYTWNRDYVSEVYLTLTNGDETLRVDIDKSKGTTAVEYSITGMVATRSELANLRAGYWGEATELITGNRLIATQWGELIVTYTTDLLYVKRDGAWSPVGAAYKKVNGVWTPVLPTEAFIVGRSYEPG